MGLSIHDGHGLVIACLENPKRKIEKKICSHCRMVHLNHHMVESNTIEFKTAWRTC